MMLDKAIKKKKISYEAVKLPPSLQKELEKEGLVSIEKLNPQNVKVLSLNYLKNGGRERKAGKLKINKVGGKTEEKRKRPIEIKSEEEKEIPKPRSKKMKKELMKKELMKKENGQREEQIKITKENHKREINNKQVRKQKGEEEKNKKKEKEEKNKQITAEKKYFDINDIMKNEQNFRKWEKTDFKLQVKKWSKKGTIPIFYTILKSLYDNQFFVPYAIQEKTLRESIKRKKDIILISKTGTGKTLAFCLPILNNILSDKLKEYEKKKKCISKLRFLILIPTRELALQIMNSFHCINKYVNIFYIAIIGGINMKKQLRLINKKPEGIICTPGRLRFFLENDKMEEVKDQEEAYAYIRNMKHIRYFVCDELDKMVENSFILNIKIITKHLYNCLEEKAIFLQTFLSSATLGLCAKIEKDKLTKLINSFRIRKDKSFLMDLSEMNKNEHNNSILPDGLILNIIKCEKKVILLNLFYFLKSYIFEKSLTNEENKKKIKETENDTNDVKKIIVFVNTIMSAKELKRLFGLLFFEANLEGNVPKKFKSNIFLEKQISTFCIHSKLEQKKRIENVDKFAQCKNHAVMFCTDVLSRGIDLHTCDLIIQLNCPIADVTFVHRSGRTARRFKQGLCVCFIDEEDIANWKCTFKKIGLNLNDIKENEHMRKLKGEEYQKLGQALQICKEIDHICEQTKLGKKSYIDKLAEDAELLDKDDSSTSACEEEDGFRKKSKNEIYKRMKFLKQKMYYLLYSSK